VTGGGCSQTSGLLLTLPPPPVLGQPRAPRRNRNSRLLLRLLFRLSRTPSTGSPVCEKATYRQSENRDNLVCLELIVLFFTLIFLFLLARLLVLLLFVLLFSAARDGSEH
jgi:hypothetical protein